MKYRITGSNKDTGARMILEFEAESKAAAERKALQQNMAVNRVEDITDGYAPKAHDPNPRAGRRGAGRSSKLMPIVIVVILVAAAWFFRGAIMARLGIGH